MGKETNIVQECRLAAAEYGARLFRNNLGSYKKGNFWIKYGVANPGGSDLIGFTKDGKFCAVEVKVPGGKVTKEQIQFISAVNNAGGLGFIAYSAEDVHTVFKKLGAGI